MQLRGAPLTGSELAGLAERWIDPELAARSLFRHISSAEGGPLVGRNGSGDYEGIAIPYVWPGEDHVRGYRLRLARPPWDRAKQKEAFKYLAAPGDRNKLYFPIGVDPAWLADLSIPIVIVEGEFKATAIYRLSSHGLGEAANKPRFLPIGLSGVSNWKGIIGKVTNKDGRRVDDKGTIPDLERLEWKARHVTILFDRDLETNEYVTKERNAFARELRRRGAKVFVFGWPAEHPGAKGIDDLLVAGGPDLVLHLLAQVQSFSVATNWKARLILSEKGIVKPILANALIALRDAGEWEDVLGWDDFAGLITVQHPPYQRRDGPWSDNDDRLTAEWLQNQGVFTSVETANAAIQTVALEHPFHPVRDYLETLEWDGIPRLDDWLTLYLGVDPSDYVRAAGARWLISAVARIYRPGVKADCCLILEGPQGAKKSTAVKILGGEWFTDDVADFELKDAPMQIMRFWIVELAELDSIRKAQMSKIKAFISRGTDHFRPPYGRHVISAPRQCVFVGTVNESTYLRDDTGARRFWPVRCGLIRTDELERDRDQLWAEAVSQYRASAPWWLDDVKLIAEAEDEQAQRYEVDPWQPAIEAWLDGPFQRVEVGRLVTPYESEADSVTITDVLVHGVGKRLDQLTPMDFQRAARALRTLRWERFQKRQGGKTDPRRWRYRPIPE
jgi:Virulence-associated protein E-like domain/Domain of unknown function (DUF3854)